MACPTNWSTAKLHNWNTQVPNVMHIDINSAFATIEQQANPLLRGVPLAVASNTQGFGCILAASREAKMWKVRTGMSVQEGKTRCPFMVVHGADPDKYRHIHQEIRKVLDHYSDQVIPKSIDEFVISFPNSPARTILAGRAREIQQEIRTRVGDWITVSIGISTNRLLAKLGSDLKHDEPFIIDNTNYLKVYQDLDVTDLCGISHQLAKRLRTQGVYNALDFALADINTLRSAFRSKLSRDWYLGLRGWEVSCHETKPPQSFGQSYVLPHPMKREDWLPILVKLTHKAARRMRTAGFSSRGVHLYLRFADRSSWRRGESLANPLFQDSDLTTLLSSLHSVPTSTNCSPIPLVLTHYPLR